MVEIVTPTSNVSNRSKVIECLTVVLNLYEDCGFVRTGFSLDRTIDLWTAHADSIGVGGWMAWMKYKTAAFFAVHSVKHGERVRLPACPSKLGVADRPNILLCGRGQRFEFRILSSATRRWWFLRSVKDLKKDCPRADEGMLMQSLVDTVVCLTTAPKESRMASTVPWEDMNEISERKRDNRIVGHITKAICIEQLVRTTKELFGGKRFTVEDRVRPFVPSTSANILNSRALGGAVGAVVDSPSLMRGLRGDDLVVYSAVGSEEHIEDESDLTRWNVDVGRLNERFRTLYWRIARRALFEPSYVIPVALAEALKVRVISKGPPYLYTALQPLQKFMWRVLKEHPAFHLIGNPITPRYIHDRMGANLPSGEIYLSGDYKAATDNLRPWVSNTIACTIADECGLDEVEKRLFLRSLTGHVFMLNGQLRAQVNGQLMGSVTSFPVLCLANAAMCRYAMEESTGRKWSLADCRLAVNGDDVLMRGPRVLEHAWRACTSFIGLTESVGKTYFSRIFCEMNSALFLRIEAVMETDPSSGVQRPLCFRRVEQINYGLISGQKRSAAHGASGDMLSGLGARARRLCEECPEECRGPVMKRFLNRNWELLSALGVPWFIPEWLGGVGLPSFWHNGVHHTYTSLDVACARSIFNGGKVGKVARVVAAPSWNIHRMVMGRMPVGLGDAIMDKRVTAEGHEAYGLACAALLFARGVDSRSLRVDEEETSTSQLNAVRRNVRLWFSVKPDRRSQRQVMDIERFEGDEVEERLPQEHVPMVDTAVSITKELRVSAAAGEDVYWLPDSSLVNSGTSYSIVGAPRALYGLNGF
jgi:hypothetical protein